MALSLTCGCPPLLAPLQVSCKEYYDEKKVYYVETDKCDSCDHCDRH
jgi:hypothetical protein